MGKIIGIDLGTTNSVVAMMDGRTPIIIPNAEGERVTPSVVGYDPNTRQLIAGTPAKRQAVTNPQNTVFSVKRFVGRKFGDPAIQNDVKLAPYKVRTTNDGDISIWMGEKGYSPAEILAVLLSKLKRDTEAYIGESVTEAVITVPAYFYDSQRQTIKDAALVAGLNVLRIINEPTAASLAYGLHKSGDRTIAVYHLGGGTFDISILEIGDCVFEVKSTNGDNHLGGDDFDQRIIHWVCNEFQKESGMDLREDSQVRQRLKWAAEQAKCELSVVNHVEINLPYVIPDGSVHRDLLITLSRAKLEELVNDLVESTLKPCKQALEDARLRPSSVDEVVLVGQQTRMPVVQEAVRKFFGKEPCRGVNPAEVVALGAAVQAGVLSGELRDTLLLMDVTPFSLGIETLGGVTTRLIERNTSIPTRKSEICTTADDNQTSVEINVLQGERDMARDNRTLSKFRLEGIPPAPKGVPQIEVTFDIDANGILNVEAKDKATGREKKITIVASDTGISKSRLEEAQVRSDAENMMDKVKISLSKLGGDLHAQLGGIVDVKLSGLHRSLKGGDVAQIRHMTKELGVVLRCIEALGDSDNIKASELLVELLMKEKDKLVRERIRQTLHEIDGVRVEVVLKPRTWLEKLLGRRQWVDS
jgi:molecular chaperone DnaK